MTKTKYKEEETFTIVDKRGITEAAESAAEDARKQIITEVPKTYQHPRPVGENVLVKSGAKKTFYDGTNFVIPDVAQESPNMGIVVALGARVNPEDVKVGDLVTFSRYNFEDIDVDGEVFKLGSVHDIKFVSAVHYAVASGLN